jgi:FSR family fosmidomycin resistance protein-like MFS transporter
MKRTALYGVIHFLVDAACVTAVMRGSYALQAGWLDAFSMVVGYDLVAFALQFPLGLLVDRLRIKPAAALLGVLLASLVVAPLSLPGWFIMLAAGLGNALYHLGAGGEVLQASAGRAAPAGVFVGPGALGLGLGLWMGRTGMGPVWPLLLGLVCASVVLLRLSPTPPVEIPARARARLGVTSAMGIGVLMLLLLSVTVRSFVGLTGCQGCTPGWVLILGIPLVGCVGKVAGGFIADRLGWIATSVTALAIATLLLAFANGDPAIALPGLLIFQMTMPVTLTAVYLMLPRHPATAFGLPCVALVGGALATFYPRIAGHFGPRSFLMLIPLAALAVLVALRRLLAAQDRAPSQSSSLQRMV